MKERITITIDKEVIERLQVLAEKESRSVSNLINKVLQDFIKRN